MFGKTVLALWSLAGVGWWIVAWQLVRADAKARACAGISAALPRSLTIFKPLPPLGRKGLDHVAAGLESFVAQLEPESELLLGVRDSDRKTIAPFIEAMRAKYPKAQLRPVFHPGPEAVANPKVAWQMVLAEQATSELWLWSDADIIAPPGFLQCARREFAKCGVAMLTFPYVVRRIAGPGALFEGLFVNTEFYPGVLLLRGLGTADFGFGAGMLFERDEFLKRVDWHELGAYLADDFQLGQRLKPVQISATTLETVATERPWPDALAHDLRWSKTIRWSRPGGFFARLLVLPVAGWLVAVVTHPHSIFAWVGLVGMIQAEVLSAVTICGVIGCHLRKGDWWILECWSLWRIAAWILSWLPGSVRWSGSRWFAPKAALQIPPKHSPAPKPLTFVD
jgi:ceramide glucosyltransferase